MTYQLSLTTSFASGVGVSSVQAVVKVGDTVSDIREGRNAGVRSLSVLQGQQCDGHDAGILGRSPLKSRYTWPYAADVPR